MTMDKIETPKEKANRLGVKLFPSPIIKPQPQESEKDLGSQLYKKRFMEEIIGICETCGIEITRMSKSPCGHQLCPFGILTNSKSK
jgi:hypothetical protein